MKMTAFLEHGEKTRYGKTMIIKHVYIYQLTKMKNSNRGTALERSAEKNTEGREYGIKLIWLVPMQIQDTTNICWVRMV